MTNDIDSILSADVLFVTGSNTTETHPVIGSFIKQRAEEGATLIVCDPRKTEIASRAGIHLRHTIGSDVALINSMMYVILEEGLQDRHFIQSRTENYEALAESLKEYSPEITQATTGIPPHRLREVARLFAKGPNSAIFYTMGITQHTHGTDNVRALCNLALLCGMFGRAGVGVNPLRGQNNVQGSCDMGALADTLPGYLKIRHPNAAEKVRRLWGCELNPTPGLSVAPMLDAAHKGALRALYIMGENPMVTDANSAHVDAALNRLDFLVVQDIFLTETAQKADVVLPAACWAEKEGTFTNTCRAVQRVRKAVNAPGQAKADWEILLAVAHRLGATWSYDSPESVFTDIADFVPAYAGMSYARLQQKPLQWPCPTKEHSGTPILHVEQFARAGGKATFLPVHWSAPHEWPNEEYPYFATTGRTLYHYHSGSMTRRSATGEFIDRLYIEINPQEARSLGIVENDLLRVTSRRGSTQGHARITERVPCKMVFLPFHFAESSANNLTASVWDKDSETPPFKVSAVQVEKVTVTQDA